RPSTPSPRSFPHDAAYLAASVADFRRWSAEGLGTPDFLDSLVAFQPQEHRVDGIRHLVVFPMYTQNGSSQRHVEAVLVEAIWPDFIARLETEYTNRLFVSLRLIDFTSGTTRTPPSCSPRRWRCARFRPSRGAR
ncbi:hypothetical protein HR12_43965, partial [Microbacterium sp. SUBG005]